MKARLMKMGTEVITFNVPMIFAKTRIIKYGDEHFYFDWRIVENREVVNVYQCADGVMYWNTYIESKSTHDGA